MEAEDPNAGNGMRYGQREPTFGPPPWALPNSTSNLPSPSSCISDAGFEVDTEPPDHNVRQKKKTQVALCIVRIVLEPNLKLGGKEVTESEKFTPGRFTASTLVCGLAPRAYSPHHETSVFGNLLSFRRGVSRYRSKASLGCWPLPSRVRSSQMNLELGGGDQ